MPTFTRLTVLLLLTTWALVAAPVAAQTPAPPATAPARLPVPDEAAQRQATKLVREVFKDGIENAKTPEQKAILVDNMLHQADESKDDPAGRFVLLEMALDQAAGAGDVTRALKASEALGKSFDLSKARLKSMVVSKLANALRLPGSAEAALGDLIAKESEAPTDPLEQMKNGDAWWDLGQRVGGLIRRSMDAVAARWYQQASLNLTGLLKAKVEKRLAEIAQEGTQSLQPKAHWTVLFRSSDAAHWNTDWNDGQGSFSVKVSTAPEDIAWLGMGMPDTKQAVIIPIHKADLLENRQIEGSKIGWNGTSLFGS